MLKKTAALSVSVFLFANFLFINKDNLDFAVSGFASLKIPAAAQNAFNVSAHINKTANIISSLFNTKNSVNITSADNNRKSGSGENNVFFITAVPLSAILNVSGTFLQDLSCFLSLNAFSILKMYIDPGGGQPPGGLALFMSYFLIMLLFFASSRKVFNNIFAYKTVKYRLTI